MSDRDKPFSYWGKNRDLEKKMSQNEKNAIQASFKNKTPWIKITASLDILRKKYNIPYNIQDGNQNNPPNRENPTQKNWSDTNSARAPCRGENRGNPGIYPGRNKE